ncbi:hypothetical protein SDC9_189525 [bioreactor metagenome]|uniref:Uncharacterized protein n=1 Tax=bioreactor metagenome TaxID=1076179 RepID=A0A645HSZ0_9ZZZZ
MRADHALLQRGGRRPLRGRHGDRKAGQGDVIYMLLRREEAARADVDLHLLAVGVSTLEVGVEDGLIPLLALAGIPGVQGEVLIPGGIVDHRVHHLLQRFTLVQGFAV